MIIKKSKFVTSMAEFKTFPGQGLPEIALAGKSNVGKSSLINSLTNNSKLARTSSAPGKTRLVNFYQLNDEDMFLVDLPGYGFAKAPRQEKEKWAAMIEGYLKGSEHLKRVFQALPLCSVLSRGNGLLPFHGVPSSARSRRNWKAEAGSPVFLPAGSVGRKKL